MTVTGPASIVRPTRDLDPTYGYRLPQLLELQPPPEPADFADFWRETWRQAMHVPLRITQRRSPLSTKEVTVYEVEFDTLDGYRTGGWVTVPNGKPVQRAMVVGHGYGGRGEPDVKLSDPAAAAIFPCARGFHRSAGRTIPADTARHVVHGIESRETYVHRGCVAEIWASASVILELYPEAAGNLQYAGGSFGGGIGALALPWDPRFKRAFLDVPSFGNHPLRLQMRCTGSGEAVRLYWMKHPRVAEVLQYFDSALSAKYIRIPTLVAAATSDPSVPPPGQFSVFNAIPGEKQLFTRESGHPNIPADDEKLTIELDKWFRALS